MSIERYELDDSYYVKKDDGNWCQYEEVKEELDFLHKRIAELESKLAVFECCDPNILRRVADLADCGDQNGAYHYTAEWLRRIAAEREGK